MIWMIFIKCYKYSPNKKHKIFVVFDYMIADMFINKKLNPIVTELFIRGRKLHISLIFITQSYFVVLKTISQKFQTNENFNKSHLIVYQVLTLKTLQIFKKMYGKTILFFSD